MFGFEIAGTFGTIVELIGQFKQGRDEAEAKNYSAFIGWLQTRRHEEVVQLLATNNAVQTEVGNLLRQDAQLLLNGIDSLNRIVTAIALQMEEFRGLVSVTLPPHETHSEAFQLLTNLVKCNMLKFTAFKTSEAKTHIGRISPGTGKLDYSSDFIEDDLAVLTEWGFLRMEYSSHGTDYMLTRQAVRFANLLR